MTPERWQRIKDLLDHAQQLRPEERSGFLDRSCSSDLSLRDEVESLLSASDDVRSSFLENSPVHVALGPGVRLGDYEVQKLIGSGGMGEVYRARDLRLRREVAIKVLPAFLASDKERLRRFEQEAQAAAALNHPNILAVFQMGTYAGAPYLVSELLEGETLRSLISRGPLPARKAVDYGVQIAHGLATAHEKGIVHRDLKPENLFVTKDGRVKILDFGLAKLTQADSVSRSRSTTVVKGAATEPGMVLGTAGYMSPEQVRGDSADHRTDIFAFGAILYEMLTGSRAFQKATSAETMSAILNEEPRMVSQVAANVPPGLQRTVHRCLEKMPEQRFQSASDLAFSLEALSDSTVTGASGRFAVVSTPRGWRIRAITTASVLAVIGLLVWWWLPTPAPVITGVRQLTDDGEPKEGSRLVTDGSRIYFNEGEPGSLKIAQVSVTGGQTARVDTRLMNPLVVGLAPDNSSLLTLLGTADLKPLWWIPVPVGEPRPAGEIKAFDAGLFPDGRIAFVKGAALFIAESDGSKPEKLIDSSRGMLAPAISPDAEQISVTLCCDSLPQSLEAIATHSHSQQALRTDPIGSSCCSTWTPDGKYLLFQSLHDARWDLWAFKEHTVLFRQFHTPVRLTNGPLSYTNPIVSRDGKRIFAIGTKRRGELVRYDEKSRHLVPYLSGISATDPTFSRDGRWVTYRSYPDSTLWRSRTDGSDRLQLTYDPVWFPLISPDGMQVVFEIDSGGIFDKGGIFVVSTEGGTPRKIADSCVAATWSPDGNLLVLSCWAPGKHPGETAYLELRIAELTTGTTSVIPESIGRCCAFWADQHTIVAAVEDQTKLLTFDVRNRKWGELASGFFVNWFISPDGQYLNYTTGGAEPAALRIRLSDHKVENVTSLRGLRRLVDAKGATQLNVAPDGSLLFARDIGTQEIYALDVNWH